MLSTKPEDYTDGIMFTILRNQQDLIDNCCARFIAERVAAPGMKFEKRVAKDPCGYEILVCPTTGSPFFGLKYHAIYANCLRALAQSQFPELNGT